MTESKPGMIKLLRKPLAWGMQLWGPIPGTSRIYLMWDGPGSGIYIYVGDPQNPGTLPGRQVGHPSASGTYSSLKGAQAAVDAFVGQSQASWTSGAFDLYNLPC